MKYGPACSGGILGRPLPVLKPGRGSRARTRRRRRPQPRRLQEARRAASSAFLARLGDGCFALLGNLLPMGAHARLPLGCVANDRGTKLPGLWPAMPLHVGSRLHRRSACRSAQRDYQREHHRSVHETLREHPRGLILRYAEDIFQGILGCFSRGLALWTHGCARGPGHVRFDAHARAL